MPQAVSGLAAGAFLLSGTRAHCVRPTAELPALRSPLHPRQSAEWCPFRCRGGVWRKRAPRGASTAGAQGSRWCLSSWLLPRPPSPWWSFPAAHAAADDSGTTTRPPPLQQRDRSNTTRPQEALGGAAPAATQREASGRGRRESDPPSCSAPPFSLEAACPSSLLPALPRSSALGGLPVSCPLPLRVSVLGALLRRGGRSGRCCCLPRRAGSRLLLALLRGSLQAHFAPAGHERGADDAEGVQA